MVARLGGIDVVIHNAGVAAAGLNETFSAGAMQRMFDVNVFGVQRVNRAVLPVMRGQGAGHVVYMGSVLGREVTPFLGLYAATKHALEAMAESYRYDLSLLGIDSTVVQPGTFPTTAILRNLVSADDPARAAGYGPVAAMPGAFFRGLQAMVESGAAPDPAAVAEAVLTVISAPAGQRAARFVVDPSGFDGAARVNATSDRVQSELLARFGLSALLGSTTA
jgi:NAD(P)-dependent dehydrogenase (short-subunit alcohol dehydrogenase family)